MSRNVPRGHGVIAVAALLGVLATGCGGDAGEKVPAEPQSGPRPGWSAVPDQVATEMPADGRDHADPVRVKIPSLGVDGSLIRLKTDKAGVIIPPGQAMQAGWFAAGPQPGDIGPAVIAGHVDSRTGPGVFAKLGRMRKGDEVIVVDRNGQTVRFGVDSVVTYPKREFPTNVVYGATPDAQLRLITCGGAFDEGRGHYADNVIVFASAR